MPVLYDWCDTEDHCNGLLLSFGYRGVVVNPATRRWALLPENDNDIDEVYHDYEVKHLAYDPTISPDYEVISLPMFYSGREIGRLPPKQKPQLDPVTEQSEWPPLVYILQVFSSSTGQWKDVLGTIANLRLELPAKWLHNYMVYWRGVAYIFCQSDYVMRYSAAHHYHSSSIVIFTHFSFSLFNYI